MEIIQDSGNPALSGAYLGVRFSSSIALTNVYARVTVGGTGYSLDATEAQLDFPLGQTHGSHVDGIHPPQAIKPRLSLYGHQKLSGD